MTIENTVFVCIGTDRSTGDSLGPLVGTWLKQSGYQVFGTLEEPVHAMNLQETINNLPKDKYILAIDACLGRSIESVGYITVGEGPIQPGAGVNKDLPSVGHYNIAGIVNIGGFMEYFVLQNTRLSLVMELAEAIHKAIEMRFNTTYQPRWASQFNKSFGILSNYLIKKKIHKTQISLE